MVGAEVEGEVVEEAAEEVVDVAEAEEEVFRLWQTVKESSVLVKIALCRGPKSDVVG